MATFEVYMRGIDHPVSVEADTLHTEYGPGGEVVAFMLRSARSEQHPNHLDMRPIEQRPEALVFFGPAASVIGIHRVNDSSSGSKVAA